MHSWSTFIQDNRISGLVRELEEAIDDSTDPVALSSLYGALIRGVSNRALERCRELGFPTGSKAMAAEIERRRRRTMEIKP